MGTLVLLEGIDNPEITGLAGYRKSGGYEAMGQVLKTKKPAEVIAEAKASGIRGRGGAGFPAGMKWSFVPQTDGPKYLLCNADESEPGTFKDRLLMAKKPHMLIEGMVIAGYAFGSKQGYIYIRGEFAAEAKILEKAIKEAYTAHLLGKNLFGTGVDFDLCVHRGAGAYICGEETALIESLEGKRGYPRLKPPFPAVVGYDGKPTVINNVETLAAVPWIMKHGGAEYAKIGVPNSLGTKLFSVSGHVNKPGVYEIDMGMPMMTFINDVLGGVSGGRKLKAVIPGGSSVPVMTAAECLDVNLDYDSIAKKGSMLGSGGMIVIAEGTCMVRALATLTRFYAHESCGQCTPCRDGCPWLKKLSLSVENGTAQSSDIDLMYQIAKQMAGNTICPLADACVMPVQSYVTKFREEFEEHVRLQRCPYPAWTL